MNKSLSNYIDQLLNVAESHYPFTSAFKVDLRKLIREVRIKKGNNILNCRESFGGIIFLSSGSAMELYCNEVTFEETTTWFWNEKEFIYTTDNNSLKRNQSSVKALEDSTFLVLDEKNLNTLKMKYPETEEAIKLFQNNHNLRVIAHLKNYSRLTAQQKINRFNEEYKYIFKVAMRKKILEFLNIKSDSFSRYTPKK